MKDSQIESRELYEELEKASHSLERCDCGSRAVLRYEPGCTTIACIREREVKMSGPDWCPSQLAREWNMMAAPMGSG